MTGLFIDQTEMAKKKVLRVEKRLRRVFTFRGLLKVLAEEAGIFQTVKERNPGIFSFRSCFFRRKISKIRNLSKIKNEIMERIELDDPCDCHAISSINPEFSILQALAEMFYSIKSQLELALK